MDLTPVFYWVYPLVLIPVVYFLSKEEAKPKLLGGILLAFIPWLVKGIGFGLASAMVTTLLIIMVIAMAFYRQPDNRNLLEELRPGLINYSNFLPKRAKKRRAVQKKAQQLIKRNGGKTKKKYVLKLLMNAYGRQVGKKKNVLKELGSL